jgi:hypothetical protein
MRYLKFWLSFGLRGSKGIFYQAHALSNLTKYVEPFRVPEAA